MLYRDYLKTEHWQQTRQEVIKKFGRHCYVCGSSERINIHHKTYGRKDHGLGNELVGDLCVLCEECHYLSHEFRRRPMRQKQLRRAKAMILLGETKQAAFMQCADSQFTKWREKRGLPRSVNEWGVFKATAR